MFFCCFNAGKHCRINFQSSIAADCVFEVIFVLIYSCTCQVSLSELCRLPVSNHKLSAHISVPWTEKKYRKDNKVSPAGLEVDEPKLCFSFTLRGSKELEEREGRVGASSGGLAWRPAEALVLPGSLRAAKTAPAFLQQKAQLLLSLQNQLGNSVLLLLFCHLNVTRREHTQFCAFATPNFT